MTNKLIKVIHSNGQSSGINANGASKLSDIRKMLAEKGLMATTDLFLMDESTAVDKNEEIQITLDELVNGGIILLIGVPQGSRINRTEGIDQYNQLNFSQKLDLFRNVEIFRGMTFKETEGFTKTFKNLYQWSTGYLPDSNQPMINTMVSADYSFSKVTHEMKVLDTDSSSFSLDTPYVQAKTEYKHEKEKTTGSEKTKEYLLSKFVVRKVNFAVSEMQLEVNEDFVAAVDIALKNGADNMNQCAKLIGVLNEWGYYIPLNFSMGGSLFAAETTFISEFQQAETEKNEFSVSFKGEFEKIGGSGAYNQAHSETQTTSQSTKYKNTLIKQIGGTPGLTNDYAKWAASLDKAGSWALVGLEKTYPSLALLLLAKNAGKGADLLTLSLKVMNQNRLYGAIKKLQPYINIGDYATNIECMLNPYS
ncbi:MAG: hypothetical protein LBT24_07710 [Tannerella sp.]|jgi:hypothetical protein|nr:hypothetical protein [Tannerella sp.]